MLKRFFAVVLSTIMILSMVNCVFAAEEINGSFVADPAAGNTADTCVLLSIYITLSRTAIT